MKSPRKWDCGIGWKDQLATLRRKKRRWFFLSVSSTSCTSYNQDSLPVSLIDLQYIFEDIANNPREVVLIVSSALSDNNYIAFWKSWKNMWFLASSPWLKEIDSPWVNSWLAERIRCLIDLKFTPRATRFLGHILAAKWAPITEKFPKNWAISAELKWVILSANLWYAC